jgi:3-isopropylmalate/(R)-2-methylmalate dehydratase small subunit
MEYGFRAVIAPSFADIFLSNCYKNGLLPIVLEEKLIEELFQICAGDSAASLTVDLPAEAIALPDGQMIPFAVDAMRKDSLVKGLDDIGMTLAHRDEIESFELAHRQAMPWLFDRLQGESP